MTRQRITFWLLTVAAVLLLIPPLRVGDLAGYDDAVYAHIAKAIVKTGVWTSIQSNGFPALEHPPGFVWIQAALFSLFGFSDFLARLPAALAGVGVIVMVYWLARRMLKDENAALLSMLVMLATPYFVKYAGHGMTDLPFTLLYAAAVYAWMLAEEQPRWYAGVFVFAAYALLTRGVIGFAVPLTLGLDGLLRGRARRQLAGSVLAAAFVPLGIWYAHLIYLYGDFFWLVQTTFLKDKINGETAGTFRRFTGVFEYAWMLTKSYWPWLPFLAIGLWSSARTRDRRLLLAGIWCAVMYAACSVGGSRVLRYLLPAYPAFSIFAALGLMKVVPARLVDLGLRWIAPLAVLIAAGVALFPPVTLHAEEIRPIAAAVQAATRDGERSAFYDAGQGRFDETGQIQWYGDRTMWILTDRQAFERALAEPISRVWIVDVVTYVQYFPAHPEAKLLAQSGHLRVIRLMERAQP